MILIHDFETLSYDVLIILCSPCCWGTLRTTYFISSCSHLICCSISNKIKYMYTVYAYLVYTCIGLCFCSPFFCWLAVVPPVHCLHSLMASGWSNPENHMHFSLAISLEKFILGGRFWWAKLSCHAHVFLNWIVSHLQWCTLIYFHLSSCCIYLAESYFPPKSYNRIRCIFSSLNFVPCHILFMLHLSFSWRCVHPSNCL